MRLFLVRYGPNEQLIEAVDARGAIVKFNQQRRSNAGRTDIRVRLATNNDINRINGDNHE